MANKPDKSENKSVQPGLWKKVLSVVVWLALLGTGALAGIFLYTAVNMPDYDPQQLSGAKTTFIYDDKQQVVFRLHAEENRTEVTLDKVPQDLKNAFIATEDQDFYKHHGINFKGILRALVYNIASKDLTGQGASTITQQLARNAFLSFDKQLERKIKEVILAFKLESNYSKDEIFKMYLNIINFGAGSYGVQAAANTYFGKDVSELTLAESALLAGLPQSPNGYNPYQYYDRAKARQRMVLNNMVKCGYIEQSIADDAFAAPLEFKNTGNTNKEYGYFVDAVIEEAMDIFETKKMSKDSNDLIYRSGLKIYTTMDAPLQSYAEELYANPANFPAENKGGQTLQSAMAVINHSNGQVKAVIGGRSYDQRRGFNRATMAYRQPGSSIKPITVYSTALENGIMPYYVLDDSPVSFKSGGKVWSPQNYDGKYRGLITMRTAVQYSINTYAVQMLDKVGIRSGFDSAKAFGLEPLDTPGANDLALAPLSLGGLTKGATPLQMAGAYATLGNRGIYIKPHFITRIEDAQGVEIYNYKPVQNRAVSDQTAWLMGNMLRTVVTSGTGTNAQVPGVFTAGKTGTSEEYKDSWFCGYTSGYAVAVWMGYDQKQTMSQIYGGGFPAKLFRAVLIKAHSKHNPPMKGMPGNIVQVSVCSKSGLLPSENCPPEQIITEYSRADSVPEETCNMHEYLYICPESGKLAGKYCPNPQMIPVVKAAENSATPDKVPTEKCDIHTEFTLQSLLNNEVYVCLDPRHGGELVRANIPGPLETGGCPYEYLEKVVIHPSQKLPYCNLDDHQLKHKKASDVINSIVD